ncbi:MAG: hypothetical protein WDW38_006083 [Sanguina aurantia]
MRGAVVASLHLGVKAVVGGSRSINIHDFEVDFLSLSYTREAADVKEARKFLDSIGMKTTKLLAKIETRQSLINFQDILNAADGIIISRGNLGLDVGPREDGSGAEDTHPGVQPAEATDVANAVLDGVDGIMLGAETLRGRYPLETITTVTSICRSGEKVFDHHYHYDHLMEVAIDASGLPIDSDEESEPAYHQGLNSGNHATTGASLANFNLVGGAQGGVRPRPHPLGDRPHKRVPEQPRGSESQGGWCALDQVGTMTSYNMAARTMAKFSGGGMSPATSYNMMGNANPAGSASCNSIQSHFANQHHNRAAMPSKMESIASSAVRAADKVGASLIVVYTHTGKTAQLVAKYRPPMPILTLVVPQLVSDSLHWKLLGRSNARQCLLTRGLMPMLAAPSPSGDALLEEAVAVAGRMGLVKPHDHVVCVQRIHDDFCVKIVAVDEMGEGIKRTPMATNTTSLGGPFGSTMPTHHRSPPSPASAASQAGHCTRCSMGW